MQGDREDPIADTGMFRAFVAKGEAEDSERKAFGAPVILALLATLVITAVVVWLLVS